MRHDFESFLSHGGLFSVVGLPPVLADRAKTQTLQKKIFYFSELGVLCTPSAWLRTGSAQVNSFPIL
jgi:hypothetical protein